MKKILILSISAVIIIAIFSYNAYASTQLSGPATRCTGYYTCHYTVNNSTGTGWVQTGSAFSLVSFLLPGEHNATYGANEFTGHSVLIGYGTAGALYHVTTKFSSTDANSGKLVNGSTDVTIGVRSKSGRGGGTTYTLVNGSINVLETDMISHVTLTSVKCNPSSFALGSSTTCTATVTNQVKQYTSIPTGTITFAASNTYLGSFSNGSCTLSSGSCSVQFKSNQEYGPGTTSIYASYQGDRGHSTSSGRTVAYVTGTTED